METPVVHPDHRQGDIVLQNGARVLTCTKTLRDGARTAMLHVPGLFRIDVTSHDDSFTIDVRNLSGRPLDSGLDKMVHHTGRAFDGTPLKVSTLPVTASAIDTDPIEVTVALPANGRNHEFSCTAMAVVPRKRTF